MRLFIPFTKFHSHQHPPWFTPQIRHHIKRLHTLHRKLRQHPSDHIAAKVNSLKALLHEEITSAKNSYESSLINDFALADNKKIYSYIGNITKTRSIPSTIYFDSLTASSDLDRANLFNHYFHSVFTNTSSLPSIDDLPDLSHTINSVEFTEMEVYNVLISLDPNKASGIDDIPPRLLHSCADALCRPLHHLFTISLRYSLIPTGWKVHKIVPIFKAGDPSSVKNYHPISLLSNISKVLEHLVYNKIISHVNTSINPLQFGFTEKSSTLQQMLLFTDSIFNYPSQTDVIYLNVSKVFDTISHGILLNKLWHIGITGILWAWFKNYLLNHCQQVSINNNLSSTLPAVSGVPQGSILGPVLFLIYMNDITSFIWHSQLLMYADDTKCFKHLSSVTDQILLQEDINAIFNWSISSQLNFNISKCIHLSFKSKSTSAYYLSDSAVSTANSQKDLSLIVSNNLSWTEHYNHIIPHAYNILVLIRHSFNPSLSSPVKIKLYLTLFCSQLMYCTPIWCPYLLKDIQNIERIQRCATKFILTGYDSNYKT